MSVETERFYITGGTLPSHAPSYIVRQADKDLLEGLRAGEFCYVLNTRQIGKSSLMVRVAHQLRAEGHLVALLDLTAIGQNVTIEEWYDGLLTLVAEQLRLRDELEDFWLAHERLGPMQRWMEAIRHVALERREQKLFLFVDEIDCVRSLPFATDEFFVGIRECYNRRVQDPAFERLTFCLLGVATPGDLIQDTRLSPFNIGRRIVLADFTLEEVAPFAHGLGVTAPSEAELQEGRTVAARNAREDLTASAGSAQGLLKQAFDWTEGHPYLTQRLCQALSQAPHPLQARDVDRMCQELFLHPQAQNTDDNLAFVRNCLLRSEAEAAALLDLYRQIRLGRKVREETTNPVHMQLRLAGIVKVSQGTLQVRNRIYAQAFDPEWLEANMPDAELRRQRLAYQRGIARAATIFGSLATLIVGLLALAVINANHARSAERNASHLLYIANMNLAQREWEAGNVAHVVELLGETRNSEERGIEWDYWNRRCHQSWRTLALPDRVLAVAFSPDEKQLLGVGEEGLLKKWDVSTGQERLALPISTAPCLALAYFPDGSRFLLGVGKSVQIRDAAAGRLLQTLPMADGYIDRIAASADGRFIATHSVTDAVTVWDVTMRRKRLNLRGQTSPFVACAFNARQFVTCQRDGNVQFWSMEPWKVVRRVQTSFAAPAITLSHNGALLAGADERGDVHVVNVATGRASIHFGSEVALHTIAFTADDAHLIAAHSLAVNVWEVRSGRLLSTFKEHLDNARSCSVSQHDNYVASGALDGTVKIWDLHRPPNPIVVPVSAQPLWHVQFSPDSTRLLVCSSDGCATTWDARTGGLLQTLRASKRRLTCAVFSHNGAAIAVSDEAGAVTLWDAASGQQLRNFVGHTLSANSIVFSPDDRQLFTGSDDRTTIQWEVATGRILHRFTGQQKPVEAVDLSADGTRLVTAGDDKTVWVWDVPAQKVLRKFTEPAEIWGVAFSPNGKRVAVSNLHNTADVWDVETGRLLSTLRGHTDWLIAVAYSPNGERIMTSSRDGSAKVWETQTGRELLTLRGHRRQVSGAAFAPKGQRLATAGQDGILRIWDAEPLSTAP